ncbi:hypothetical protein BGX21_006862, partial [Mortierella sp. AD011]
MERKAQDNDSSATQPEQSSPTAAGEKEKEKDVKLASMSSSSSSLSDSRQQQDLSDSDIRVDAQTPKSVHQPEPVPLTPSSTCDGDSTNDEGKDNEEHGRPSTSQEDETVSQESYDPEIQVATTGNRIQQTPSSSSPVIAHDRDARMLPMRSDSTQSLSGTGQLFIFPLQMSTRSDQSLSQGQASDLGSDAALQQVITERNSLRSQNDQLWKIIEKQRIIIQNLQKDVAKVVAERDLLRRYAAENENF